MSSASLAVHWAQHLITSFLLHLPFAMSLLLLIRFANATGFPPCNLEKITAASSLFLLHFFSFCCSCVCHLFWLISCASLSFSLSVPFSFWHLLLRSLFFRVKKTFFCFSIYCLASSSAGAPCLLSLPTFPLSLPSLLCCFRCFCCCFLIRATASEFSHFALDIVAFADSQAGTCCCCLCCCFLMFFLLLFFGQTFRQSLTLSLSFLLTLSGFAFRR